MAVRIYLEIGHEASLRTKKTQEGFTHDWEVFVRGCDGAEIHSFVEKVVFYLHDTFPKPKRVVKEPPYTVKESGYAGFNLPIDVYLRNSGEPKKIRFNYDLHLQQSGPTILKVQKEKYVFNLPNEEFRMKLLKGGGMVGGPSSMQEVTDSRSSLDDKNQMTNKPKLAGCDFKKQKLKTGEPCRDFQELFGSPITMSSKMSSEQKPKQDSKGVDKPRTKHSPHKDSHKDKEKSKDKTESRNKDDKKQKEKSRDRERSKDKSMKKDKSPRPQSPSPKRSPKRSSPSRFSSPPVVKHKEPKQHEKDKRDKVEEKKQKKEKRNKDHKENKHGDESKTASEEHKDNKVKTEPKKDSNKTKIESSAQPTSLPAKVPEKKEKSSKEKSSKDLSKSDKSYSEKYKHKKKDKEKRDKREEKPHKLEKKPEKPVEIKPTNLFKSESQPKKEKASPYLSSVPPTIDDDSSNSSTSSSSSSVQEKKAKIEVIKPKEEKNQKLKKEKGYQDNAIKCKRKSNSVEVEEPPEKVHKEHGINNNSDGENEVKPVPKTEQEEEEDYFGVLRELQHKIMGLKENSDLQKVVKLIAETGRYEVSAHTFDFDLCLLDRSTVQQLQDFFASET